MMMCKWELGGAVFTIIAGILLHFVYDWSGRARWAAILGSVNESTWEHLKLLFWPMVAFATLEYLVFGRSTANFIPVKVLSILVGMFVIVTAFYTYTGIIGRHFLAADILIFIVGVALAYLLGCRLLHTNLLSGAVANLAGCLLLWVLIFAFIMFTWTPPSIRLFQDPVTRRFGIAAKRSI